jgi:Ser/Thr protein kinase RdoA (MazF antagonist)
VGDTVRRPTGPWTPAVHALLKHLEAEGYGGCPRALGMDDKGREILSWIPGECVTAATHHALLGSDDAVAVTAVLLRGFHDAVASFLPPPGAVWREHYGELPNEIICHHDAAVWNLVVDGDGPRAFIDWDWAAPGPRLWDVAYCVSSVVPLTDTMPAYDAAARDLRLLAFCDAYGLSRDDRAALPDVIVERTWASHDFLSDRASAGEEPWRRLWADGHGAASAYNARFAESQAPAWLRLLGRG